MSKDHFSVDIIDAIEEEEEEDAEKDNIELQQKAQFGITLISKRIYLNSFLGGI